MMPVPVATPAGEPAVAVAIVCICSAAHLARCLEALGAQQGAPPFTIIVACDPAIDGLAEVGRRFPHARISSAAGERTPLELASAALRACHAQVVLLTEDHCVPRADWVRSMLAARAPGRAAVGGRVEARRRAGKIDWAFHYVDFFRYCGKVSEGPSSSLTVCNVAYDRELLHAVSDLWAVRFEEAAVHQSLRERFGPLWLTPDSVVVMHRSVSLGDALRERYGFGRIFGQARIARCSRTTRWLYAAAAPALPILLLGRMTVRALTSRGILRPFMRALLPLTAMVVSWSWGEWMGYLTGRPPRFLVLAPERRAAERPGERRPAGA